MIARTEDVWDSEKLELEIRCRRQGDYILELEQMVKHRNIIIEEMIILIKEMAEND